MRGKWLRSVELITEATARPAFSSCASRWYATCAVVRTKLHLMPAYFFSKPLHTAAAVSES